MYEYSNEELIQRFEACIKRKYTNEDTVRNYIYDIKTFNTFLKEIHFFDATKEDVEEYIRIKLRKQNSYARINFSISVLKSFYDYLKRNKYTKNDPTNIPRPKVKKKETKGLSASQIYELRKKLKEIDDLQLEVFFGIMISAMPKKYCIKNILWRKVNWEKKYIEVETDNNKRHILYLDNYTMGNLKKLRNERKDKKIKQKWVFITRHDGHWNDVSDETLTYWLNKIKKVMELEKLDFNIMRKSSLNYWKTIRKFSDEKIDLIIKHKNGYDIEFRNILLKETEQVLQMK